MTVSKRTRFEVLRRDNYTCRYCRSADNPLRVDHVTPVALGGTDNPTNLVAACQDCNAGKASSSIDAETVADIRDDAVRWSAAMQKAAAMLEEQASASEQYLGAFLNVWGPRYLPPTHWMRLPAGARAAAGCGFPYCGGNSPECIGCGQQ